MFDVDAFVAAAAVIALRVVSLLAFDVPADPGSPVWSLT